MASVCMEQRKSCFLGSTTGLGLTPFSRPAVHAKNACLSHRKTWRYSCLATLPKSKARPAGDPVPLPYPLDWDFRSETRESCRLASERYPALRDLFESGELLCLERPADYQERRDDGYLEPQNVFLLGTCHVSNSSADAARRVIHAVKPESVIVELCRSRVGMMFRSSTDGRVSGSAPQAMPGGEGRPNAWGVSGESFVGAMGRTLRLGGRSALAMRLLLASVSATVSSATGVAVGEEFIAAREAAEAVGAQLVLGDRPIEITLKRAWGAMGAGERLRFLWIIATGGRALQHALEDPAVVQRLQTDDAVSRLYTSLASLFPSLTAPLVHERDMYLAWSLKRSKAVNGARNVVGVLGRGHLPGVAYAVRGNGSQLRFKDLVGKADGGTESSLLASVANSLRADIAIAAVVCIVYSAVKFWATE